MLEKLAGIEERYDELERLMGDPDVMMDYSKITEYSKERSSLEEIVKQYRDYKSQMQQLDDAKQMLNMRRIMMGIDHSWEGAVDNYMDVYTSLK